MSTENISDNHEDKALSQIAVISWVACSEKLPTVVENGNKVLIYRIMNDSQESLAISIHETSMVKYCNIEETWWMELPKPPCI
jgi:RecB family endonuclease NucS